MNLLVLLFEDSFLSSSTAFDLVFGAVFSFFASAVFLSVAESLYAFFYKLFYKKDYNYFKEKEGHDNYLEEGGGDSSTKENVIFWITFIIIFYIMIKG